MKTHATAATTTTVVILDIKFCIYEYAWFIVLKHIHIVNTIIFTPTMQLTHIVVYYCCSCIVCNYKNEIYNISTAVKRYLWPRIQDRYYVVAWSTSDSLRWSVRVPL